MTTQVSPTLQAPDDARQAAIESYRRRGRKKAISIAGLIAAAFASFIFAVVVGPIDIAPADVFNAVFRPELVGEQTRVVIQTLRLPAAVMAVLCGAALGLAGGQMQTILDNPLAEPFTLGISAAAAFGAALSIVMGWTVIANPQFNLALMAALSALIAVTIVAGASVWRGATAESMILLGIALSFFFQALLSLLQYGANIEALQQIVFWTMGSMQRANWTANIILAVVVAAAIPFCIANSWRLTALRLGDDRAAALGIDVKRLRITTLLVASFLAAAAVAFTGIIGFVGLVGPHVARMLVGEDQKYFLPGAAAAGAMLLSLAYAVSLSIIPGLAIPIGIITSLVGVPFFVFLIFTRAKRRS
ncbi:Hemin transport system permease protein HmuU [Corynebacterium glaucum]|uniref:Hemin transport system permease protein HmuU n=1 Tax=Corynebacterium glaucum TaxID=187491 RepID=A0A1Q2HVR7_9CORY|nr:iron ABC transporter permease [Corynebacterium glaucum]AQQ14924.1 Hemin transport system permease protein HmuU [Corynebacterium glaucum]